MNTSKLSVVIPCYNQAQYLDECLQSVIEQTYPNWDCIIVNDGSTDNTEEVALKWTEIDKRVIYLKKENGGLSSARNFGINYSDSEFILPLDSDDKISPNYIQECLSTLQQNEDIKITYGNAYLFGDKDELWDLPPYSFELILKTNLIFCSAIYRKKDWELNKGYDTNLIYGYEDWEFWINLLKRGGKAERNPKAIFYYRIKESSMIKELTKNEEKFNFSREYIFIKHFKIYNTNFGNFFEIMENKERQINEYKQLEEEYTRIHKKYYNQFHKKLFQFFKGEN